MADCMKIHLGRLLGGELRRLGTLKSEDRLWTKAAEMSDSGDVGFSPPVSDSSYDPGHKVIRRC